jgi:hypothetical protein
MTAADQIRQQMKSWTDQEVQSFAAKLLIVAQPGFHGSKQIHYADGKPMKLVDTVTRPI